MWKKKRLLAAYMLAIVWWSIFYPELCFAEGTCVAVQMEETQETDSRSMTPQDKGAAVQDGKEQSGADVSGILQAGRDEVVIGSRFLEWCEETLPGRKE